jgi:hypothetical protein
MAFYSLEDRLEAGDIIQITNIDGFAGTLWFYTGKEDGRFDYGLHQIGGENKAKFIHSNDLRPPTYNKVMNVPIDENNLRDISGFDDEVIETVLSDLIKTLQESARYIEEAISLHELNFDYNNGGVCFTEDTDCRMEGNDLLYDCAISYVMTPGGIEVMLYQFDFEALGYDSEKMNEGDKLPVGQTTRIKEAYAKVGINLDLTRYTTIGLPLSSEHDATLRGTLQNPKGGICFSSITEAREAVYTALRDIKEIIKGEPTPIAQQGSHP